MCPGGGGRPWSRDEVWSSRWVGGGSSAWMIEVFVFNLEVSYI